MARTDNIASLFGKSPITPLQKHMKQVHSCLKDFNAFAKAANAQDWEKAETARISIKNKCCLDSSRKSLLSCLN